MRKYILLIILFLLASSYIYMYYNPIVIKPDDTYSFIFNPKSLDVKDEFELYYDTDLLQRSDTLKLFEHFDFSEGNWKACVFFRERYDVIKSIPKGKYLEIKDMQLIRKFQDLSFEFMQGDVCILENELIIYKDDKIVFRCAVALDNAEEGFQSHQFGWIKSLNKQLTQLINEFKRPIIPIVFY